MSSSLDASKVTFLKFFLRLSIKFFVFPNSVGSTTSFIEKAAPRPVPGPKNSKLLLYVLPFCMILMLSLI